MRANETKILETPWLDQHEKWPTGCESVTASLALRWLGFPVDPDFFIDNCLPRAPYPRTEDGVLRAADPEDFYLGDPRTEDGWGCFAPAIRRGLERFADLTGEDLLVRELHGMPLDKLFREEIDRGLPVILFATMGMAAPRDSRTWICDGSGRPYTWKTPMHCLLLIGYDRGSDEAVFSDPLAAARTRYPIRDVERAYRGMGSEAVVVEKRPRKR
ncbi:MAG: C39 family peptidase [Clostridia bacterium]|nr:C39 family peptidase [Clostridia bacterium]MBQ4192787.1 C39 family peptidase [Clostridia bacterium]MBQ4351652.1 C39 family peptidase [Clostridia bacterium]